MVDEIMKGDSVLSSYSLHVKREGLYLDGTITTEDLCYLTACLLYTSDAADDRYVV